MAVTDLTPGNGGAASPPGVPPAGLQRFRATLRLGGLRPSEVEVHDLEGLEELGAPFAFRLRLVLPPREDGVPTELPRPRDLVGTRGRLAFSDPVADAVRYFHCDVLEAAIAADPGSAPHLELLLAAPFGGMRHNRRYRTFENASLSDAILLTLDAWGISAAFGAVGDDPTRRLVVQHDESDLAFVSRSLEELGATYHFEHEEEFFRFVVRSRDDDRSEDPSLFAAPAIGGGRPLLALRETSLSQPSSFALVGEERTFLILDGSPQPLQDGTPLSATHTEHRAWPAPPPSADAVRIMADRAPRERVEATTHDPFVRVGHRIRIAGFSGESTLVVASVRHAVSPEEGYRAELVAFPCSEGHSYRPPRRTARPSIPGVVRATVVEPAGAGSPLRVLFPWQTDFDGDPSVSIPIAQPLASPSRAGYFAPKRGDAILVGFAGGDPSAPVVLASILRDGFPEPVGVREGETAIALVSDDNAVILDDGDAGALRLRTRHDLAFTAGGSTSADLAGDLRITSGDLDATTGDLHVGAATILVEGQRIHLVAATIVLDAAIVRVPGVVRCDTLITDAVVAKAYTPGAGNIW